MLTAIQRGEVLDKQFTTNRYAGKDVIARAHRGNAVLVPDT